MGSGELAISNQQLGNWGIGGDWGWAVGNQQLAISNWGIGGDWGWAVSSEHLVMSDSSWLASGWWSIARIYPPIAYRFGNEQ